MLCTEQNNEKSTTVGLHVFGANLQKHRGTGIGTKKWRVLTAVLLYSILSIFVNFLVQATIFAPQLGESTSVN